MKRTIVGVALIAGLAQFVATPAQAAPGADPVKALRAAFTRGKAVNVVSVMTMDHGHDVRYTWNVEGTIGFGQEGELAADVSQQAGFSKTLLKHGTEEAALGAMPLRVISSGNDDYVAGPRFADVLPRDTTWVRYPHTDRPASNALLEILEPATLKALVAHRTSWQGGVLKGRITTDKLAKVSSTFSSRFLGYSWRNPVSTISYAIHLSPTGLVERVSLKSVLHHWKGSVLRVSSDTRFSDWGREVIIQTPLPSETLDQDQLEGKVPYEVPGAWN